MRELKYGLILALLLTGMLASGYSNADTPKSWLLLCKGGNNTIEMHSKMYNAPGSTARFTATTFSLNFSKSDRPASAGLAAGFCAWPDRGFRSAEPALLSKLFEQVWVISKTTIANGRESTQYTVQGRQDIANDLTQLLNAVQQGRDFQVHVYSAGEGALVISKVGP